MALLIRMVTLDCYKLGKDNNLSQVWLVIGLSNEIDSPINKKVEKLW